MVRPDSPLAPWRSPVPGRSPSLLHRLADALSASGPETWLSPLLWSGCALRSLPAAAAAPLPAAGPALAPWRVPFPVLPVASGVRPCPCVPAPEGLGGRGALSGPGGTSPSPIASRAAPSCDGWVPACRAWPTLGSQSGLKVLMAKMAATNTVTHCANSSQSRFSMVSGPFCYAGVAYTNRCRVRAARGREMNGACAGNSFHAGTAGSSG